MVIMGRDATKPVFGVSECYVALPHGAVGWSAVCDGGIS